MSKINSTTIKESAICKQFVQQVKQLQAFKQFKTDFTMLHVPNEQLSNPAYIYHLLGLGMLPGAADYLILYEGGRVAAIEFKRDKTCRLSNSQKAFKETCDRLKIPYLCTYKITEAIDFLKYLK